jgi:hypothetical protein
MVRVVKQLEEGTLKADGGEQKAEKVEMKQYSPAEWAEYKKALAEKPVLGLDDLVGLQRAVLTVDEVAVQLSHTNKAFAQIQQESQVLRMVLGVLCQRQGGSVTVREAECDRLGQFDLTVIDHPQQRDKIKGGLLEVRVNQKKPGIVIAQDVPKN